VTAIAVSAERGPGGALLLRYVLTGNLADLVLAAGGNGRRRDGLWRSTCFEAFVEHEDGYVELNLASSGDWAAYRFDGYRAGMRPLDIPPPRIATENGESRFVLEAEIDGLPDSGPRLGLAAVIEETDRSLSYWALAHPPGPPDFHHPDCFALDLPPPPGP